MSKILEILIPKISAKSQLIDQWFAAKFKETPPAFYNSVDLRHSYFKIAPVDTNCFPAGFNNLSQNSRQKAKKIAQKFIDQYYKNAKNILIIPENHTRNLRYLENISILQEILQSPQNQVAIGTFNDEIKEKTVLDLENGRQLILHPLQKNNDSQIVTADGFVADLIILNNDLTSSIPKILQNTKTPITPSTHLGWFQRTKSHHFTIYNNLAQELARILEIDPWLISSLHRSCHKVNFKEQIGLDCLARNVEDLLGELQKKYHEYGIDEKPYCYIKADNGTYGMAVMTVSSSEEALDLNKKERNKMNMLKESTLNTAAVIQEGILTSDKINDKIAEPMIYMINGEVVGNLFRVNDQRDASENLNTAGMNFFDLENLNENELNLGASKNDITLAYSLIARLAALAAAMEKY